MALERTSTRKGHNLSANKTIGKSGNHPVLSGRSGSRYETLGYGSEIEALVDGVIDSGGPRAMEEERNTTRSKLGLTPDAKMKHVRTAQNRKKYGNVVSEGEPLDETVRRLAREASFNRVRRPHQVRQTRKTWYKPWTWLNGGNKLNFKKRKSLKTRKHKTRKRKTRKQKRK